MNIVKTMGYEVFSDTLDNIELAKFTRAHILNTISPNSYGIATYDHDFKEALKNSDYLVLDGVYFALASLFLQGKNIKKNQGPDVFKFFINKMNTVNGKVFFLGSSEDTLLKIKMKLNKEYKNISADFLSPPFKKSFSPVENKEIINKINEFGPDIIFIGMTCPKQEKWANEHKDHLDARLICSVGAVFDWYAGNQKDINPIWWKLRLGWLKRTIDRPEILKRYPNIGVFFWHLFLSRFRLKKF